MVRDRPPPPPVKTEGIVNTSPRVPPNCTFEVDDLEKEWTWKQPFDFIHSSNIGQGIRDWPAYTKSMFDNLVPGGVVQLHESQMAFPTDDDSLPKGGYLDRYITNFEKALDAAGLTDKTDKLEGYLKDAGFVDVKVVTKKIPYGPWAKDKQTKVCFGPILVCLVKRLLIGSTGDG